MIEENKRVTYQQIRASLGIGINQVQKILHENLGARKLCTRWIPHNLTDDQKHLRMDWCRQMFDKFDIVKGDESWIYCYEPETKRQSAQWVIPFEDRPTKVKKGRSQGKKIIASFFGRKGHFATVVLEDERTVTAY